ncbi:MAG: DNA primase [Planctomycetota bacterium]
MQDLEFRELVERVKLRSPIATVVGERVKGLKKRGALLWACCPFHTERTPSFAVDPRRGTWRCYGACGEGGDALSFLQRFDGLSFLDALRLLAESAGEKVPDLSSRPSQGPAERHLDRLRGAVDTALRRYRALFAGPSGARARAYIRNRGFTPATEEAFGLGWAPESGNPILEAAGAAGIPLDLLVEAGLAKRAEDGRPYDFFHGRLLVPIRDRLGRAVAFGGRLLPGDERSVGKYVNTPETPLFHKGRIVFGLDRAAAAVRQRRDLILMEGYTDVMAAHQTGFPHAAALLGTSTTEEHASLVRRSGAHRIFLVFDGDEAGRAATERALAGLLSLGLELRAASPPEGKDPADILLGEGPAAFAALLEGARDWFPWLVEGLRGAGGAELAAGVDRLFLLFDLLPKPVEREVRLRELADSLEISRAGIAEQWRAHRAGRVRRETPAPSRPPAPAGGKQAEDAFRALVGALLLDNSLIPLYAELVERCPPGDLRVVFEALLHLHAHGDESEPVDAAAVIAQLADHPARDLVVALELLAATAESPQALARDQELWLERQTHARELADLRARLGAGEGGAAESPAAVLKSLHERLRERFVPASGSPRNP